MKARALAILREAMIEIPDYALSDRDLWTVTSVKTVLVEAERRLRKTSSRVGPRGDPASWPPYMRDEPDPAWDRRGYERWMTVDRMNHVMEGWTDEAGVFHPAWLAGPLLGYPQLRRKLLAWIRAVVADESSKMLCERRGWPLATFKRHRDRAAYMIADRLNRADVEVWDQSRE